MARTASRTTPNIHTGSRRLALHSGLRLRGFTIVEMLVVVVVIGILAGIVVVAYNGVTRNAKEAALMSDLSGAADVLAGERLRTKTYPTELPEDARASNGATFTYSSDSRTYCVEGTAEDPTIPRYHVTETGRVQEGACPLHLPDEQIAKLFASDGTSSDSFGYAVSIHGDTAVIGAPYDAENGSYAGSAYVFTRSGGAWAQQAKLSPNDSAAYHEFGVAVSLSGDTALVGAYGDADNGSYAGAAYVFTRSGSTWTQQAKLLASDGAASGNFGGAVSLSGDSALIGAEGDDENGSFSGAAYVFTRSGSTWTQRAKLLASDGNADARFGDAVSLSDDTALVGAPYDSGDGFNAGAAYVFIRSGSTWSQQAKLTAGDSAASDYFGHSVALVGGTALIGADWDDDNGPDSGSAYLFARSGSNWTQQAKLFAGDGAARDYFGSAVSLSGDSALVGAPYDDDRGASSGSAYVFE